MPTLYVVATPIGNLEDVTLRALRILKEVGLIAAEDTRTTLKLLRRYGIRTRLVSFYEQNRAMRIPYIMEHLKEVDVALVSEAGTPTIRDPGRELVAAANDLGVTVVPVPGPSAVTAALAVSGLPSEQFLFLGFLPRRRKERRELLESVASEPRTLVAFEAPHRLRASLVDLAEILGDGRLVVVCRELTKLFEEVYHGTLVEASAHFSAPRGEYYESEVPDTLDLADRASLAMNHLTGMVDPTQDYEIYISTTFCSNPARSAIHGCGEEPVPGAGDGQRACARGAPAAPSRPSWCHSGWTRSRGVSSSRGSPQPARHWRHAGRFRHS